MTWVLALVGGSAAELGRRWGGKALPRSCGYSRQESCRGPCERPRQEPCRGLAGVFGKEPCRGLVGILGMEPRGCLAFWFSSGLQRLFVFTKICMAPCRCFPSLGSNVFDGVETLRLKGDCYAGVG